MRWCEFYAIGTCHASNDAHQPELLSSSRLHTLRHCAEHSPHQRRWVGCSADPSTKHRSHRCRFQCPCKVLIHPSSQPDIFGPRTGRPLCASRERIRNKLKDRYSYGPQRDMRVRHVCRWVSPRRLRQQQSSVFLMISVARSSLTSSGSRFILFTQRD